jgi:hypothetical protein
MQNNGCTTTTNFSLQTFFLRPVILQTFLAGWQQRTVDLGRKIICGLPALGKEKS